LPRLYPEDNLVLIGKAIEFLPYFIFAFAEMGRHGIGVDRGRYKIDSITDQFGENDNLIFDGKDEIRRQIQIICPVWDI